MTAVSPDAFDREYVCGAIAFAECCYGAEIHGRTPDTSCALKLQNEGAAFVGSTGLAFGSYIAPGLFLDDADFMARAFFEALTAGKQKRPRPIDVKSAKDYFVQQRMHVSLDTKVVGVERVEAISVDIQGIL